jgi:hypothetical protein
MPFSPFANPSFLSKCGSTVLCHLRTVHLWLLVVLIFILGALRNRIADALGGLSRRRKDE